MTIIEPHIHMYSRTTDDYERMYAAGIRCCIEPSFWLGTNRRYAGTFFDYFRLILEFETVRARRRMPQRSETTEPSSGRADKHRPVER